MTIKHIKKTNTEKEATRPLTSRAKGKWLRDDEEDVVISGMRLGSESEIKPQ